MTAAWRAWLPFAAVASIFGLVATHQMQLPGIYADAINPDYLVARILNPDFERSMVWVITGNSLLGDRAPVLISLYHGSQQFWLGLPLYAIFGTTVEGVRLTHATFALGVLAALYALLLRCGLRPWLAAVVCALLAVDPSFSYSFRTQAYITVAPAAWLLLALVCLARATEPDRANAARWWFASGVLCGLAAVGYFVWAFVLPPIAVAAWRAKRARAWAAGLAAGAAFYPIGYLLIARKLGSIDAIRGFVREQQSTLGVFNSTLSIPGPDHLCMGHARRRGHRCLAQRDDDGRRPRADAGRGSEDRACRRPAVRAVGARRDARPGHAACAHRVRAARVVLGVCARVRRPPRRSSLCDAGAAALRGTRGGAGFVQAERIWRSRAAPLLVALGAINVAGQVEVAQRLAATRGKGFLSDAIHRFAADLNAMPEKPFLWFPEPALALPLILLTRASIPMSDQLDDPEPRRLLCAGRDVAMVRIDGHASALARAAVAGRSRVGLAGGDALRAGRRAGRVRSGHLSRQARRSGLHGPKALRVIESRHNSDTRRRSRHGGHATA